MPDCRITLQRLRDHLRRLWYVYLAGIVALAFLNNLVYTVTRPGYSDDETLKIMLLNSNVSIAEERLLEKVNQFGFRAVETLPMAVAAGDPTSEMLLTVQLVGGFGDICIADAAGFERMALKEACMNLEDMHLPGLQPVEYRHPESGEALTAAFCTQDGAYLMVIANGTDTQSAAAALSAVAEEMME